MRIFIGLACLALVASASFVNKKLSKTNCEYENDNECPNGLDGCCPSLAPYCCPDNIWCTDTPNACPAIMPKLIGKMLPKKLPMEKTKHNKHTKTVCENEDDIDCNDGSCCWKELPYCCPNKLWCAETPDECPPINTPNILTKKALPKKLPMVKTTSASFVNKKLSKTNCEYENDNECPNGLYGCCPSYAPYCCPDNIWCTDSLDACPAIMPKLIGKMLPKQLPMVKTTSASYVPKKIQKTKRSSCGFEEIDCNDGSCCEKDFPYCCPNKLWCAETPDECPPIKKALPKRLPMGKITSASYVHKKIEKWECDPTEDNVCYDGKGCCGGDFPVCCPNNRCGARGDDC